MRISIVIPVYNKEQHLKKSVYSALGQTHEEIEVIAVDDGSTDGSAALLEKIATTHKKLKIHTQKNQGLSGARNAGIKVASGDFILFHDADDVLELDAAEHLAGIAEKTGSDIVGGVFRRISGDKAAIVKAFSNDDFSIDFKGEPDKAELYSTNFSVCNKMFRKSALDKADIRFTPDLYMQDIEFWLKVIFLGLGISQSREVVSNYIAYADSWSQQKSPKRFESLFVLFDRLDTFYTKHGLEDFTGYRNHALIQGAIMFFARWKLEDWAEDGDAADLKRLQSLLQNMPKADFASFFGRKNASETAAILLFLRDGDFATSAKIAKVLKAADFQVLKSHGAQVSADEIMALSQKILVQETTAKGRRIRRRRNLRAAMIYKTKVLLFPYYEPVRDQWRAVQQKKQRKQERDKGEKRLLVFGLGDLYAIGGVQLSYKRLFEYLCQRGFTVSFYSHRKQQKGQAPYYQFPAGTSITHYTLADTDVARKKIADIARREQPDVILVVNSGQTSLVLLNALYDLPYPVLHSERGGADHCLEHNWFSKQQRQLAHVAADLSHVLMPSYIKSAPKWLHDYVHVIPSLTETAPRFAAPDEKNAAGGYSIIYTGRMSFEKDLDLLLRAFARLSEAHPDWQLELYGDGPDKAALEALRDELGSSDKVLFHGSTKNYEALSEAYSKSHIFVLTSRAEGCPLSIREAMAHGLPVIGFDSCSGTNEIVKDGQNGVLAKSDDKVRGLTDALETLMTDAKRRKTLGQQAIEDVKQFDPDHIHDLWEKALRRTMTWHGRRQELRLAKKEQNPQAYDAFEKLLRHSQNQGVSRNIFAFGTGIRGGDYQKADLRAYLLLFGSCLFDPVAYSKHNPALKPKGIDPLYHYITEGWKDDALPEESLFDQSFYTAKYMDGQGGLCPLVHFYETGRHEGALPSKKPSEAMINQITREISNDGQTPFDPCFLSSQDIKEELANNLAWRRLDFSKFSNL